MVETTEMTTMLGFTEEDANNLKEAFDKFADALIEVGKALAEAFQKVVEWVKGVLDDGVITEAEYTNKKQQLLEYGA